MAFKFLRRDWKRYPKLGKGSKKKQKWRRPKGRDNKMREKRRGYPAVVSVGYKKGKEIREKIEGKNPITVKNLKDIEKIDKNNAIIIGKVGKKKRLQLLKRAKEKNIEVVNLNVDKLIKKLEKKNETR